MTPPSRSSTTWRKSEKLLGHQRRHRDRVAFSVGNQCGTRRSRRHDRSQAKTFRFQRFVRNVMHRRVRRNRQRARPFRARRHQTVAFPQHQVLVRQPRFVARTHPSFGFERHDPFFSSPARVSRTSGTSAAHHVDVKLRCALPCTSTHVHRKWPHVGTTTRTDPRTGSMPRRGLTGDMWRSSSGRGRTVEWQGGREGSRTSWWASQGSLFSTGSLWTWIFRRFGHEASDAWIARQRWFRCSTAQPTPWGAVGCETRWVGSRRSCTNAPTCEKSKGRCVGLRDRTMPITGTHLSNVPIQERCT